MSDIVITVNGYKGTWKNKNGTSDRECACGSWRKHWENFSKISFPEKCSVKGCPEKASLGAHVINNSVSGEWIAPLCASCNKRSDEFYLKPGTILVSANEKLTLKVAN